MRRSWILALVVCGLATSPSGSEPCHDWDGDGAVAGLDCSTNDDCDDFDWKRSPSAPESCDGVDNNCDGTIDEACDRSCVEPTATIYYDPISVDEFTGSVVDGCAVAFADGGFLAVSEVLIESEKMLLATGHDRWGNRRDGPYEIGHDAGVERYEKNCALAVVGDRALVAWYDDRDNFSLLDDALLVRVLDRLGRPRSPEIDISAVTGIALDAGAIPAVVWNGQEFAVFWTGTPAGSSILMNRISADGVLLDQEAIAVHQPFWRPESLSAVWLSDHYVVYYASEKAYSLRCDRDGLVTGGPHVVGDFQPGGTSKAVVAGNMIALVGSYSSVFVRAPWLAWLTHEGVPESGGAFEMPMTSPGESGLSRMGLSWSGEVLFVSIAQYYNTGGFPPYPYRWWLWRALPTGELLDLDAVPLGAEIGREEVAASHWDGELLRVFGVFGGRLVRQRVACSCDDLDGDTFDACGEFDCDDQEFAVNPAQAEDCRGGIDDDCDRLIDCDDPSCPGSSWAETVAGLVWHSDQIQWTDLTGAGHYDLARGLVSDLKRRGDFRQSECSGAELSAASWLDDGRRPPAGDALWYLVRPEGADCEFGGWGVAALAREPGVCR